MLLTLYLTVRAVQLDVPLAVAIVVQVLAAVGLALATSPGFIGTLQAAFVLGMVPFGVAQDVAVTLPLVYQALTTIPLEYRGGLCGAAAPARCAPATMTKCVGLMKLDVAIAMEQTFRGAACLSLRGRGLASPRALCPAGGGQGRASIASGGFEGNGRACRGTERGSGISAPRQRGRLDRARCQ